MDSQAERAAKNEALFRDVNERIAEIADSFEAEGLEVLCECSSLACSEMIQITPTEYASVRSRGARFALIAGHEDPTVEGVVEQNERFLIVEKFGESGDVARERDPRRS